MKLERKITISIGLVALLIIGYVLSGISVRTITNTGDNIDTFIRNSKGNYWTATGANLRLAINDCANTTNTVYLPTGTITGCQDIRLWSNVSLKGAGMYNTILQASGACSYGVIFIPEGNDNFTISDLTIDGNRDAVAGNSGILARKVKDFAFLNLHIHDTDFAGLYLDAQLPNVATPGNSSRGIVNNVFINNTASQPFAINNASEIVFSNLRAEESASYGFDFHGIKNCTISNLMVKGTTYGIKIFAEGNYYNSDITMNNVVLQSISATGNGIYVSKLYRGSISNIQVNNSNNGFLIESSNYIDADNINVRNTANSGIQILHSNNINLNNAIARDTDSNGFYFHVSNNCTISNLQCVNSANYNLVDTCKDFLLTDSIFYRELLDINYFTIYDSCF